MPRFAVLDHDHPCRHWDFFLEAGEKLRAWRLLAEPQRGMPIAAEPLPDHRPIYLDYEGPVSGDRGCVTRWDAGTFEWDYDGDGELRLFASGSRIVGAVELNRTASGWTWEWS